VAASSVPMPPLTTTCNRGRSRLSRYAQS
jgi:hypothetical protein